MLLGHFGERLASCSGCDYCDDPAMAASKVASSACASCWPKAIYLSSVAFRSLANLPVLDIQSSFACTAIPGFEGFS